MKMKPPTLLAEVAKPAGTQRGMGFQPVCKNTAKRTSLAAAPSPPLSSEPERWLTFP